MVTTGSLYIGETLLAVGRCALWPEDAPTGGTLLGGTHSLLKYDSLVLVLVNNHRLTIAPRRIEHQPGEKPLLVFDVLG
jgi:hypothetical protein